MTSDRVAQIHADITARSVTYLNAAIQAHREAELPKWGPQRWIAGKVYDSVSAHIAVALPGLITHVFSDLGAMSVDDLLELCGHA